MMMMIKQGVKRQYTKDREYLHTELPYGLWTHDDGREVLFNRGYRPMWTRRPGQPAQPAKSDELHLVKFWFAKFFYREGGPDGMDVNPKKLQATITRCEAILREWGVRK
jgi:hypothetical protein